MMNEYIIIKCDEENFMTSCLNTRKKLEKYEKIYLYTCIYI